MSDPKDKIHSTPLTSSAGGASGTRALSVKVDSEPALEKSVAVKQFVPNLENSDVQAESTPGSSQTESGFSAEPQAFAADLTAMPVRDLLASLPQALETASRDEAREVVTMDAVNEPAKAAAQVSTATRANEANLFDQFSKTFNAAFGDAGSDAARITFALVEFAQASARNNLQFAQDYVGARSVPELVNVQAAYLKRQMELMNRQTAELRQLALEITSKKTAQLQGRALRR